MSKAIIPIEQRTIDFYEDKVTAVVADDGTVYVPVRPLCELIGVAWEAQARKLRNDPVLSEITMSVIIRSQTSDRSKRPETSTMICLPLDYLNGWLFGINANRVKPEVKDVLMSYQRECYKVLSEAFTTGVAVRPDSELMQSQDPAAFAFRNAMATARLARQHYYLSKQVDDNTKRIGLIEAQLSNPASYVTQEQAQSISGAVKAIATELGKVSGRNEFGAVYGELYQRVGVTSYKHIPTGRYDDVMGWLRDWWQRLTDGSNTPF